MFWLTTLARFAVAAFLACDRVVVFAGDLRAGEPFWGCLREELRGLSRELVKGAGGGGGGSGIGDFIIGNSFYIKFTVTNC